MATQISLRIPQQLLSKTKAYSEENGYDNLQECIRDILRETVYNKQEITEKEFSLIKRVLKASMDRKDFGTEEELFKKLKR